jgi:murein tripeptide amidase MpaA
MPEVVFNRYYPYDELTSLLKAYESENPGTVALSSIGKSHEGRDIWLVTVTDLSTGPASDKPAFWCDGNIHASELSASTAVLKVLDKLVGGEPHELLKTRAFYLVPRLNPDGAEWSMETPPRLIRSSTRTYPYAEPDPYGLERKDLDGDGRILNMRVPDPNGPWKISEKEPRLLDRRAPGETGGKYYRVLPEGIFHNFDGMTMRGQRIPQGLDMNRNFPNAWRPEHEQHGAGPFPTSEPEIRAAVDAICQRPNICGAVTFHTFSGVHLRPPGRHKEDDLPAEDLWAYQEIGKKGTEMTGYPAISVFHDFRYHPKEVISGVFDDWMYEHRGVYAWTTEIWSPQRQAGITDYKPIEWFREHPFEDDIALLKWSDEKLEGKGYEDWKPFEHPQLGPVEIGGWDAFYAFRNPPPQFLEKEVEPLADWAIWQAGCIPKLGLRETKIEPAGSGAWRIRFAVQNEGWLPTQVTRLALEKKMCRGVQGEIQRSGAETGTSAPKWLVSGALIQDAGQLAGWNHVSAGGFGWHLDATDDVAVFEWVVQEPGDYTLLARHERAGNIQVRIEVR